MSEKFKATKRCYLIDHHSPQPPIVPLTHMDIAEYDDFFLNADIDSLMVYCKDHWGVTYYDSKISGAQKHEGIKGDWIRTVRDKAKERDIEFVAYYCIEYDEGAARRFPQWRVRKADGSPLIRDDLYAKWSLMCYQTGYREYALSQLEEIITNYHPDSLFLDIFGASLCYCDSCKKKFVQNYGYALSECDEEISLHRQDIISFLNGNAKEFYLELQERLKSIDPALAITINFACHYPKELRDLLDYQYSEPLLKDNWFSSAYARDTAIGQYPMLAPGEASQVYNYDSSNKYICDLSSIAAQGCRVGMYSGSQHIDGTLEHEEAKRLGSVFAELKKLEPFLSARKTPVKSVGIIQSDLSKTVSSEKIIADAILRMKRHNPHTNAILGAMMTCEQAKIPYTILSDISVTKELLADYDLIIFPEVYVVCESLLDAVKDFTAKGGKVIISSMSGLYNEKLEPLKESSLSEITGNTFISTHTEYAQNGWSAYLQAEAPSQFKSLLSVTTPPVSDFFVETKPVSSSILAHFVVPAVACSPTMWINWWSPPPGERTSIAAITLNSYGKGDVLYLGYDFFTMAAAETYRDTKDSFCDFLQLLDVKPVLQNKTSIPNILRTAFFETESSYHIHQISTLPTRYRGEIYPVSGGEIVSLAPISKAVCVYPEKIELSIKKDERKWIVELPSFEIQQYIVLEK